MRERLFAPDLGQGLDFMLYAVGVHEGARFPDEDALWPIP
jgi:hypothetical protein